MIGKNRLFEDTFGLKVNHYFRAAIQSHMLPFV